MPADAFIRWLITDLGRVQSLCVGQNFMFGHRREGTPEMLRVLGTELGFEVVAHPPVLFQDKPISSTRIREAILTGHLGLAESMLGRAWGIGGRVTRGDAVGRQLGFPTANVDAEGLALPPLGVYVARAIVAGQQRGAVVNIGYRPTVTAARREIRVEAHLIDFDADLYGAEIDIIVGRQLRAEMRFNSLDELKAQIARDVAAARQDLA